MFPPIGSPRRRRLIPFSATGSNPLDAGIALQHGLSASYPPACHLSLS